MRVENFYIGSYNQNPTGWQLLASTTLSSGGLSIDVSNIPARTFYHIIVVVAGKVGADSCLLRFNGDSGANYDFRTSSNGAADATTASATSITLEPVTSNAGALLSIEVFNITTNPPRLYCKTSSGGAAGTAPNKAEVVGRWTNSGTLINQVTVLTAAQNMNAGSSIFVYGSN